VKNAVAVAEPRIEDGKFQALYKFEMGVGVHRQM